MADDEVSEVPVEVPDEDAIAGTVEANTIRVR